MAIQKPYETSFGVAFPEAYWMIGYVAIARRPRTINAAIDVFVDNAAREEGKEPVATITATLAAEHYDTIIAGGIPALYEALKADTLAGGLDV